jgi:hypothetical protein
MLAILLDNAARDLGSLFQICCSSNYLSAIGLAGYFYDQPVCNNVRKMS